MWIPCSSEPAALTAWPLPWHFRSGEKHSLFFWEHMDTFGLCQRQLVVLRPGLIASPQCLPNASRVTVQKTNGISSTLWEAQSHFFSAHTFCHCSTLSPISLFLLVKSHFQIIINLNYFSFPCSFSFLLHSIHMEFTHTASPDCFEIPIQIDLKACRCSMA